MEMEERSQERIQSVSQQVFEGLPYSPHYEGPENAVVIKTQGTGGQTGLSWSTPSSTVTRREETRMAAEVGEFLMAGR